MTAILPPIAVSDARKRAALTLRRQPMVRLQILNDDDVFVVTSPDADWLVVTSQSPHLARQDALEALLRVAEWCGARVWLEDPD